MKLTEEEKQLIIEYREKQKEENGIISFSDYIKRVEEEVLDPNDIEDACDILDKAIEIEECESGDLWQTLVDLCQNYKCYISNEFHNATKEEIKDIASNLMNSGKVQLGKYTSLVDW